MASLRARLPSDSDVYQEVNCSEGWGPSVAPDSGCHLGNLNLVTISLPAGGLGRGLLFALRGSCFESGIK